MTASRTQPSAAAVYELLDERFRTLIDVGAFAEEHGVDRFGFDLPADRLVASLKIDALWVKPYGRFGNLIMQLTHALDIAKYLDIGKIFFDLTVQAPNVFKADGEFLIDDITMIATDFRTPVREATMWGTFWSLHALVPVETFPEVKRDAVPSRRLFAVLSDEIRLAVNAYNEDEIVVHFRGGDIFNPDVPNPDYIQPPLAFYQNATILARKTSAGLVHVVYEDEINVVLRPYLEWLDEQSIAYRRYSAELKDDLKVMLSARTVVASYGTFVPAVLKLSPNIQKVFVFDNHLVRNDQQRFRPDVEVVELNDLAGGYVRHGEWLVSEDQLAMMLWYPRESVG